MAQQQTKIARQQGRYQEKQKDPVFSFSPKMNLNHLLALPLIGLMFTAHMLSADAKLVPTRLPKTQHLGFVAPQPPPTCLIKRVPPSAPWPEHVAHIPHAGVYVSETNFFKSIQCVTNAVHNSIPESMVSISPLEKALLT